MDPSKEVQIISSCTIEPSKKQTSCVELSLQRCELTPWDLIFFTDQHLQKGLLFHKPQLGEDDDSFIHRLKTSLSRTLDYFTPLAGRLAFTTHDDEVPPASSSTSFFIDCNGTGAQFIHATANVTMSDILDTLYVPHIVYSFFPLTGIKNYDGCSQPLLTVQVTELVDAVFVGCSINHIVVDGTSFWHFFNTWSEISRRGGDNDCDDQFMISNPPILNRRFPNGDHEGSLPVCLPFSPNHFVQTYGKRISSSAPVLEEVILNFSCETILTRKEKANTECGFTNENKISSLQSLLAHVWRSVTRARRLPSSQETTCYLLMGSRTRLQPPLPEYYIGNAVLPESATTTAGELLERDLGWAALMLNRAVASHTDGVIRRYRESWAKKPLFPQAVDIMKSGDLVMTSSPRFNMYGNDFGWGRPVAVRSGGVSRFPGKIAVFSGVVEICLQPQTLRDLFQDSQLMETVTEACWSK